MWLYKHESVILTFLPHLVSCIRKAYENSWLHFEVVKVTGFVFENNETEAKI
jgi:hypothetical protein